MKWKFLKPEDIRVLIPIPTPRPERAKRGSSTSSMYLEQIFYKCPKLAYAQVRKTSLTSQHCCRSGRRQGWGTGLRKYSFQYFDLKKYPHPSSLKGLGWNISTFQTWTENLSPGHRRLACIRVSLNKTFENIHCQILKHFKIVRS